MKKTEEKEFKFNIALSVLNHLGRNLYRNFITVVGEAISNSWDADADNVWITIDKDNKQMIVKDDGIGMTADDFQKKFLTIGYSKRDGNVFQTAKKRAFIGRKGIGKLALLSCSDKVHVASKVKGGNVVGGVIDNSKLDEEIEKESKDKQIRDYKLESFSKDIQSKLKDVKSGTIIIFENIKDDIVNTLEYIKQCIALYFRFSLHDKKFKIFVNNEEITFKHLEKLINSTQFVWNINDSKDKYIEEIKKSESFKGTKVENEVIAKTSDLKISGFIATVKEPKDLVIRGTKEKVSLDLFVNGRLRERDILKHIPTARIVESYTYGQIHYDLLDSEENTKDIFTSSRESVISDNPLFTSLLEEVKKIFASILDEWDDLRVKNKDDGDPDGNMPKTKRKARELYNQTLKDTFNNTEMKILKKGSKVEEWADDFENDAGFNIPSYTECFIVENMLRKYVTFTGKTLTAAELAGAKG